MSHGKKSLTELRGLLQSMGGRVDFKDDINALNQKIALKQTEMIPPIVVPAPAAPEDQRLRTRPPSKISDEGMIAEMLQPYIDRGLHLSFSNGQFHMKHGEKTDTGTLRQPPRVIVDCARRVMA